MSIKQTVRENGTLRVQSMSLGISRTEQNHKNRVDIKQIMSKARNGITPSFNPHQARYGDFTQATDFQEMSNRVIQARNEFMSLPSRIRKRFNNDPGLLIDFLADEDNYQEALELGLVKPRPVEESQPEATEGVPAGNEKAD